LQLEDLATGERLTSRAPAEAPSPKVALHPDRTRVAIAQPVHIAVLDLH
jgi:hypothetical protein